MTEPHKVSEPSALDLYRENQGLRGEIERLGKELKYSALAATAEAHEADRLQGELARVQTISDNYYALVVELNAREAKLREALDVALPLARSWAYPYKQGLDAAEEALTLPHDDTALKERLRQVKERIAKHFDSMPGREMFGSTVADEIRAMRDE